MCWEPVEYKRTPKNMILFIRNGSLIFFLNASSWTCLQVSFISCKKKKKKVNIGIYNTYDTDHWQCWFVCIFCGRSHVPNCEPVLSLAIWWRVFRPLCYNLIFAVNWVLNTKNKSITPLSLSLSLSLSVSLCLSLCLSLSLSVCTRAWVRAYVIVWVLQRKKDDVVQEDDDKKYF